MGTVQLALARRLQNALGMKPVVICVCTLMLGIGGLTAGVVSQLHASTGETQTIASDAKPSDPRMVAEHIPAAPTPRDVPSVAGRLASR